MDPHENPAYQDKLLGSFAMAYSMDQLSISPDSLEKEFESMNKKMKMSMIGSYVIALGGALLVDKKFLRRYSGESFGWRRGLGFFGTMFSLNALFVMLSRDPRSKDLTWQMALKYENQVITLYPELSLYYSNQFVPSNN